MNRQPTRSQPTHHRRSPRLAVLITVLVAIAVVGMLGRHVYRASRIDDYRDRGWIINSEPILAEPFKARFGAIFERPIWLTVKSGDSLAEQDIRWIIEQNSLERLTLTDTEISDELLNRLVELENLVLLDVSYTSITDEGIGQLRWLPHLGGLIADGTAVTGAGLEQLAGAPRLSLLSLRQTNLRDEYARPLQRLASLTRLWIDQTAVTDATIEHLEGLALRQLTLSDTHITDKAMEHIEYLPFLTFLDLSHTQVSDAAIDSLIRMTDLRDVRVAGTAMTPAGLERLRSERPDLRVAVD